MERKAAVFFGRGSFKVIDFTTNFLDVIRYLISRILKVHFQIDHSKSNVNECVTMQPISKIDGQVIYLFTYLLGSVLKYIISQ